MNIADFTAAEVLMITRPSSGTGRELMKYSLMDLVLKQQLRVYSEWRKPHERDRERCYTYVSRGKKFDSYHANRYQDQWIDHFKEDNEYQLYILAKYIYKRTKKGSYFKKKYVYKALREQSIFNSSFGFKHLNTFFLSRKGYELQQKFTK
ncbi:MAG: hypothetical protein AAGJ93_13985, partial [Bacteroidota bacterium]